MPPSRMRHDRLVSAKGGGADIMKRRQLLTTIAGSLVSTGITATGVAAPAINTRGRWNWAGRDLSGQLLKNMDLAGADLRGCRLVGTDFSGSDLRDARIDRASIINASFDDARMAGVSLEGATILGSSFDHTDLTGCNAQGATIGDCTGFWDAVLNDASFRGANFSLVHFGGATLIATDFRDVILDGLMIFGRCMMAGTEFEGMRCQPITEGPIFIMRSGIELFGCDATRINLKGFTGDITCLGTSFRNAILVGTRLDFLNENGQPHEPLDRLPDEVFNGAIISNTWINGRLYGG